MASNKSWLGRRGSVGFFVFGLRVGPRGGRGGGVGGGLCLWTRFLGGPSCSQKTSVKSPKEQMPQILSVVEQILLNCLSS